MPLNPTQYSERRDTLALLLRETADALRSVSDEAQYIQPGLIQGHIAVLLAIRNKVFEDQFKLVLVARFQGGKSTTFNAVAMGGRVISPMGDGAIKCSASLIAARNCEDPALRGVTLKWRTVGELEHLCADVLTSGPIDLTTPTGLAAARAAFEAEFELYQASRDRYPADKIELLPIVDLITRFVADPALGAMQQRLAANPPSAAGVAKLVRFPDNFSMRWPNQAGGFTLEESLFVFLGSTNLADESSSLKRLGLEVVDCPGLFASRYDTSVATAMIATADAVWYLLDGKAAGDGDLKAIALCRQLAKNALFVSVNLKADINPTRKHITTKIMPHIEGQLAQAGVPVALQPYHALLALLSQTGARLLRGGEYADNTTFMRQLVDDWSLEIDEPNAAGYWSALCEHLLDRLKSGVQDFRAAGGQLNEQTLAIVERESGLTHILGQLEQFVVSSRAHTILITRGVNEAISAVENGVERPLAALEATANQDEKTAYDKYEEAENALARFEQVVQEQLEFIEGGQGRLLDEQLAEEFFEQNILSAVPGIASGSADEIANRIKTFKIISGYTGEWIHNILGQQTAKQIIQSIVQRRSTEVIRLRAVDWMKQLGPEKSQALATMFKQADRINNNLQEFWQVGAGKNDELEKLGNPSLPVDVFEVSSFSSFVENTLIKDIGITVGINALITGILTAIAVLLPGIGTFFVAITATVSALFLKYSGLTSTGTGEKINIELCKVLNTQLMVERKNIIDRLLLPEATTGISLSSFRENIVAALKAPIEKTRIRFDAQRHDAEALFQKASSEREGIAEDCRRLREERVVPLRLRLEAYRSETEWAWRS
ncbi:hypothetical protein [Rhodoferax antarcticus]|uniref:hypothetical protein n=1 Tax=Rhodoferax antarcticus TaxID=81479 RepID=UPI002224EA31|nr:hypothetical protein [Rhodoferax antarcticus]MCW2311320.1 hypothetical protein [Rhodoferax antarcticus]